jgi:hypothetical protein
VNEVFKIARLKYFIIAAVPVLLAGLIVPFSVGADKTVADSWDTGVVPGYSVALLIEGLNMPTGVAVSGEMIWVAELAYGGDPREDDGYPAEVREMDRHGDDDEVRTILRSGDLGPGEFISPVTDIEYDDEWLWMTHRLMVAEGKFATGVSRFRPEEPVDT